MPEDKNGVPYQEPEESWIEYNQRLTKLGFYISWKPETVENYEPKEEQCPQ